MAGLVRVTDAASLGLHATVLLASSGARVSTAAMAHDLGVSSAHLAKVLQRLAKAGIVRSERGPRGGFTLARPPGEITLAQVFEAIEGPLKPAGCLLGVPSCDGTACIFGGVLARVEAEVASYLATTTLERLAQRPFPFRAPSPSGYHV